MTLASIQPLGYDSGQAGERIVVVLAPLYAMRTLVLTFPPRTNLVNAPLSALNDRALLRDASYVGGDWLRLAGPSIDVTNPATGELIARVPKAGREETAAAITQAQKALPGWSARTAKERAAILRRWHDLIVANVEDLARIPFGGLKASGIGREGSHLGIDEFLETKYV